ncbi:CHASE2 domain-containing protein [Methylophaga sp. OBS3]|uniref:CHASE2 domain-containing protein n=1 Tax=Methylophaga sp. OBS3 TaxID=2991934 RepID=UPI00224D38CF|nr:CHASE2 domain-containing protein [Methylophaga sp. OBS3]MCX4189701.1 CHASE2 domain-containing protein [Methylophaga sp. OBS3]
MNLGSISKIPLSHLGPVFGLLALIVFHLLGLIPFQQMLRSNSFDLYQNLMPRERISAPAVIVEIDEQSLAQLGQWPWPRSLLAKLIDRIGEMQPAAIALDIIMPEADRTSPCQVISLVPQANTQLKDQICNLPSNDELLADSLSRNHAILGVAGIDSNQSVNVHTAPTLARGEDPKPWLIHFNSALTNLPLLSSAAAGHAILSTEMERGVIRRLPLIATVGNTLMPTLSMEMLRIASGNNTFNVTTGENGVEYVGIGDLQIRTQNDGTVWLNYSKHSSERFISAVDVLRGNIDKSSLDSKLVLLGFSGLGLVDFPTTALGERVPGVEIHAQMLEAIFDQTSLDRPEWTLWLEALFLALAGLIVLYLLPKLRTTTQVIFVVGFISIMLAIGFISFRNAYLLIDVASPLLMFVLLYMAMLADSLIRDEGQIRTLELDLQSQREAAAKVQGEMEAAKRFQMGILPDPQQTFENEPRVDIAAIMEPAKMVGGDLYDCFMLDEHHMFFSLGDVCGKGVPASLFMVISKTLCKSVALRDNADFSEIGALISQANKEIARDNPEMLFVTAFIGILDLRNGELNYCNAGHERPLIIAPDCRPKTLDAASGPPISIIDDIAYESFRYRLSPEEFICVFTDGVTEATNVDNALFGSDRLENSLKDVHQEDTAATVLDRVCKAAHAFVDNHEPSDDLTMMVIRWRGN